MFRALMHGTGETYASVRAMWCHDFWRRVAAANRWTRIRYGAEDETGDETERAVREAEREAGL